MLLSHQKNKAEDEENECGSVGSDICGHFHTCQSGLIQSIFPLLTPIHRLCRGEPASGIIHWFLPAGQNPKSDGGQTGRGFQGLRTPPVLVPPKAVPIISRGSLTLREPDGE